MSPDDRPKGTGSLIVTDKVLNLQRTNTGGRFRITLLKYQYGDQIRDFLPRNDLIEGKRQLRLSYEAKTVGGSHTIIATIKKRATGDRMASHQQAFSESHWIQVSTYFLISPSEECTLWIDDQNVSKTGSSVQIRNIVLAEIAL